MCLYELMTVNLISAASRWHIGNFRERRDQFEFLKLGSDKPDILPKADAFTVVSQDIGGVKSRHNPVFPLLDPVITFGLAKRICLARSGMQHFASSGVGARFSGGRHLTMLQIWYSSGLRPYASTRSVRRRPACPTNGRPCSSSLAPGPSPTNISGASIAPR